MSLTLSPMQHRVASMYAAGLPRHEIARRLGLSLPSVDTHWRKARARTCVETRREMAAALQSCEIAVMPSGGVSREGYRPGDAVRVVGGLYRGRDGVYVRRANARQVYVRIGGGTFALMRHNAQRVAHEGA